MFNFIFKKTIKDYDKTDNAKVRTRYGLLAGIFGIISNILLFAGKITIGILTASVSIIADAMNNLSDFGSSVITILGFKLSARPADDEHPYGHARYEYISGLIVSFIILIIGLSLGKSSFDKIKNPNELSYDVWTFVILGGAVIIKLFQMLFYIEAGKRINSEALKASAMDSRNDCITTCAVIIAALIIKFTGFVLLDAIVGMAVSLFVIISALKMVKDTIDPLLGEKPNAELVAKIKSELTSYEGVIGFHDLIVHNYGPSRCFATVHVEVDSNVDIFVSHDMIDNIEKEFLSKLGINLVIHMDPTDVDDPEVADLKNIIGDFITRSGCVLSFHDLRLVKGPTHTNVVFDVVVGPEDHTTRRELQNLFDEQLRDLGKNYYSCISIDRNYVG